MDHCDSIGCYKQDIDYGVPLSQIEALISLSENCEQFISFGCLLAPLANVDQLLGGWLDRSGMNIFDIVNKQLYDKHDSIYLGQPQHFFSGDHRGDHICSCGETDSCLSNGVLTYDCNCDSNLPIWASDDGKITAKDLLPMTQVFYGPLLYDIENANFTIGRLRCTGKLIMICPQEEMFLFLFSSFRKCSQK